MLVVGFAGCIGGEGEIPPDEQGEEDPTTLDDPEEDGTEDEDGASSEDDEGQEDEQAGSGQQETVQASFQASGSTPVSVYASVAGSGYGFALIPPFAEGNETFHDESLQLVTELEFQVDWEEPVEMLVNVTLLSEQADDQAHVFEGSAPIKETVTVPDPYGTFEITVSAVTHEGDPSLVGAGVGPSLDYQLTGNATMVQP